jgi:hypothetical protein
MKQGFMNSMEWRKFQVRSLSFLCCLILLLSPAATYPSDTANQKTESSTGVTIEDIGRGLKSAAKNIGDEIPKIGPAIGDTFKNITGKEKQSEKPPTKRVPKDKQ